MPKQDFIPAARLRVLTPLYDVFSRRCLRTIYTDAAKTIDPKPGDSILDVGCGPATLIAALKQRQPALDITGVDIDPEILAIAKKKLRKAQITVELIEASATQIPLQESFNKIVSTLMFHHLSYPQKQQMLREVYRLLAPDGTFYLYDFAPPRNWWERLLIGGYRRLEDIEDGIRNRYRPLLREAGFSDVTSPYRSHLFEMLVAQKEAPREIQ